MLTTELVLVWCTIMNLEQLWRHLALLCDVPAAFILGHLPPDGRMGKGGKQEGVWRLGSPGTGRKQFGKGGKVAGGLGTSIFIHPGKALVSSH